MRNFGVVESTFWTEQVNELSDHGTHVVLVALYLKVCPHASLIGIAHCPVAYMAADTGLPTQQVEEALRILEGKRWLYRQGTLIFVPGILRELCSQKLQPTDHRVRAIEREVEKVPPGICRDAVISIRSQEGLPSSYVPSPKGQPSDRRAAHMPPASPSNAPQEVQPSQDQDQDQKHEPKHGQEQSAPRSRPAQSSTAILHAIATGKRATRLPIDWQLPTDWENWALLEKPGWTHTHCQQVAASFADYWHAKAGADANKLDWQATWRNWVRNEKRPCRNTSGAGEVIDMAAEVRRQLGLSADMEVQDA